jgi:hypothetical protein
MGALVVPAAPALLFPNESERNGPGARRVAQGKQRKELRGSLRCGYGADIENTDGGCRKRVRESNAKNLWGGCVGGIVGRGWMKKRQSGPPRRTIRGAENAPRKAGPAKTEKPKSTARNGCATVVWLAARSVEPFGAQKTRLGRRALRRWRNPRAQPGMAVPR